VTRGHFIVFEGPEGAGKTTQVARLAAKLRAHGLDPLLTREPGGTPTGDRIRSVLLDPSLRVDPATEYLLYAAARAQHVREVIAPALAAGKLVISDRFTGASIAYQGYGRGLDLDWIHDVNRRVTNGVTPDRVIWLDLAPSVGLARVAARGQPDRLEAADIAFHERVREGFAAQAREHPSIWHHFDATRDEATLESAIFTVVQNALEM
jgi:dTMP kinase